MGNVIGLTTRQVLPDRERVTSLDVGDETSSGQRAIIGVLDLLPMKPKFRRLENGARELVSTPATLANIIAILKLDPEYADRFRKNMLTGRIEVGAWPDVVDLEDHHATRLHVCLADAYRMDAATARIQEAIISVSADRGYHPVRDYLEAVKWDGVERLDTWLSTYMRAADTTTNRMYARRWAVSCVARVFQPGCKVDTMLILAGKQGSKKSSAFMALGGAWYREGNFDPRDTKAAVEVITGAWIYELGELDTMRRSEQTAMKSFLSRQEDTFRQSYARNAVNWKRQTLMVGTTNEETFLSDSTGNRRYWPVLVGETDLEALAAARDQLWAEAVAAYRAGERWWFDADEEPTRASDLAEFESPDSWLEVLENHWDGRLPTMTRMTEVYKILGVDPKDQKGIFDHRIATCLRKMGYAQKKMKAGPRIWKYEPQSG